jgi:nucleotide-binding universal stress UspA family protein
VSTNGTTPEQIEADIARQREELAATIDELHAKFDVKARLTTESGKPRPELLAAAAVVLLASGLLVWRRTHHS